DVAGQAPLVNSTYALLMLVVASAYLLARRGDVRDSKRASSSVASELQHEVMRILHEAFSSAIRHGQATRIEVTVITGSGGCGPTVRDNGRGFEVGGNRASDGVGLNSLVERWQRLGGRVSIESSSGCGASVRVSLPCWASEVMP